jgi:xanthine dehydrogenase accessory factor
MNAHTRATAFRWFEEGRPAMVVVVLETLGSVPRTSGARMVVSAGEAAGTIGGGQLDQRAIFEARALLQSGGAGRSIRYKLDASMRHGCGGALTVGIMRLDATALTRWPEPPPLFRLQLYGTGPVAICVARLLSTIDCRVDWVDEHEECFPHSLFEGARWPNHINTVAIDDLAGEVRNATPDAYYVVATHDDALDLAVCEAVLRRGDFGYLGVLASRAKHEALVHHFEEHHIPGERIARMTCPIGLPGIHGKEPELIALAIVAQLVHEDD